jgi:enoyl-[acyl-carrier protein] reductase II
MPLVPQIVDAVGGKVPVVAAGGIIDGRGLAAALALGADGVWVGTRFIATPEARSTPGYKDALLRTPEDGTTVTRAYTGKTLRAVENSYTKYFEQHPEELAPFPNQVLRSTRDGAMNLSSNDWSKVDPDKECYPAGQGVGAIQELVGAGELVRRFVEEAEHVIERIGSLRGVPVSNKSGR